MSRSVGVTMNHYPYGLFILLPYPHIQHHRCVTCGEIPTEPQQHDPCGHIFCRNCATGGINRTGRGDTTFFDIHASSTQVTLSDEQIFCQGCAKESDTVQELNKFCKDMAKKRDIERLLIRCPTCGWEGSLLEYMTVY